MNFTSGLDMSYNRVQTDRGRKKKGLPLEELGNQAHGDTEANVTYKVLLSPPGEK